jgi:hypothetical protein
MDKFGTPPIKGIGGEPLEYNDPAEAADYAKKLSKAMGEKLCVKPVADETWKRREFKRFVSGEYRQMPWCEDNWWNSDPANAIHMNHYAHPALEKPGWIAYTKSDEDGVKNKQSLLRPGAYLNRYFEKVLYDYGMSKARLIESFMMMYGPIDIKFATTAHEMVRAYDLLHTCLYGRAWPKDIHPVKMYDYGDLQVAYIGDLDAGKVSARSLVWPEKKLHSRVYGDIARLQSGLERMGYKWGAPIGAKIRRIQLREPMFKGGEPPHSCFLVPYIDKRNQQGGGHLGVIDKGDHLEICEDGLEGSHHCGLPDGRSGHYVPREDEHPKFICSRCDDEFKKLYPVYHRDPDDDEEADAEELRWCNNCRMRNTFECGYSGHFFTMDTPKVEVGGVYWEERYANMYAITCQGNGRLYKKDQVRQVYPGKPGEGWAKWLSIDYIGETGQIFTSQISNRFYWLKERTSYFGPYGDRYFCTKHELKNHTFECDGCGHHWQLQYRNQWKDEDRLLCSQCEYEARQNNNLKVSKERKVFEKNRELRALPQLPLEAAE